MATLHQINPPRVRYVEQCAGSLNGKRALDVGCGGGLLSEALAAEGAEVCGIDMAAELIDIARLHALESERKVDYRQISAEALAAAQAASFDLVCCMDMPEQERKSAGEGKRGSGRGDAGGGR